MGEGLAAVVARLRAAGCVFAEDEARLLAAEAASPEELAAMVDRRVAGFPLEQVVGWAEFCGLRIAVEPGVFVPRRRTEFLARQAAVLARRAVTGARPVVVDLCCGTGAVGAALLAELDDVELYAADIDSAAAHCARRNLGGSGSQVYQGDLFDPLPASLRGRVDVLVANAPYVPTEAIGLMPPEAREHEPRIALDGGPDGVGVHRRVAAAAPQWLAPGGHLLVETGASQVTATVDALVSNGFAASVVSSDELAATVVVGTMAHTSLLTL